MYHVADGVVAADVIAPEAVAAADVAVVAVMVVAVFAVVVPAHPALSRTGLRISSRTFRVWYWQPTASSTIAVWSVLIDDCLRDVLPSPARDKNGQL